MPYSKASFKSYIDPDGIYEGDQQMVCTSRCPEQGCPVVICELCFKVMGVVAPLW